MCCFFPFFRCLKALDYAFKNTNIISLERRFPVRSASPVSPQHRKDLRKDPQGLIHFILCIQFRETEPDG